MAQFSEQRSPQGSDTSESEVIANPLTLDQMPYEIILNFLEEMPDIRSVHAFASSCKAIYGVFKRNELQILSKVFLYKMDEGVRKEATITECLKREKWKDLGDGFESILRVFHNVQDICKQDNSLENIKDMWRLHKSVEYFADRIPTTLLRDHPVTSVKGHFSLTPKVRARFQRALYRLSSYLVITEKSEAASLSNGAQERRILPDEERESDRVESLPTFDERHLPEAFCTRYSVVEVEQVASVCFLLIAEIAPCFNHFIEHDIEFGSRFVEYITTPMHPAATNLVALGLTFWNRFLMATTRDELYELFQPMVDQIPFGPDAKNRVLFPIAGVSYLRQTFELAVGPYLTLWENGRTPDLFMSIPFFDDHDSGPASARSNMGMFVENRNYRVDDGRFAMLQTYSWAYVFWDLKMLENSGFKDIEKNGRNENDAIFPQDHPVDIWWEPLEEKQTLASHNSLALSSREKRKVLESGQTGYFDFETFCENNKDKISAYDTYIYD
ncbi:hypothetical protein FPOA_08013 [Fusarium poae]|uniref:Uncharacterized protein n=1 Tax=Fusarium poae TaxID=36050 RepID=A0A1B8AMG2_FUSPO|nr:hypothetical protein FPOA_08013 [Fusarium poae]